MDNLPETSSLNLSLSFSRYETTLGVRLGVLDLIPFYENHPVSKVNDSWRFLGQFVKK